MNPSSARILVIHSSRDGQTEKIARRIGSTLESVGMQADVVPTDAPSIGADLADCDGVIVGAGVRYGNHTSAVERLVRRHFVQIVQRPNAFFSVSLSAGGPGAKPLEAARHVDKFSTHTSWHPHMTATFAGALLYTRYNFFIRWLMKRIVGSAGGETDTSRDYEYTDWAAVERFAHEFAGGIRAQRMAGTNRKVA